MVIPYPHHADRHQELNAIELGEGVRIVSDANLNGELAADLLHLTGPGGEEARDRMGQALGALGRQNAAALILEQLASLAADS